MASGPITSWQMEEEKVEAVTDFLFMVSKITVDGNCKLEIRRQLLLDSVLKIKHITFPNKGPYS